MARGPRSRVAKGMDERHSDALLGGMWSWQADDDELSIDDPREQVSDLLRDLIDTLDD